MNRRYNRPTVAPIVPPIQIKHVHSCVSYQGAIYQIYDRRDHASPSGYGPLGSPISFSDCCMKEDFPYLIITSYFGTLV